MGKSCFLWLTYACTDYGAPKFVNANHWVGESLLAVGLMSVHNCSLVLNALVKYEDDDSIDKLYANMGCQMCQYNLQCCICISPSDVI